MEHNILFKRESVKQIGLLIKVKETHKIVALGRKFVMTRNSLLIEVSGYIEETEISADNIDNRTRENPPQF